MNREDIIRMAREAGLRVGTNLSGVVLVGSPAEIGLAHLTIEELERFAALVADAEREKLAAWMMRQGYATGHGDTIKDLLVELEWQVRESEREACAKACEQISNELSAWPFAYEGLTAETKFVQRIGETIGQPFIEAIRARGKP